MYFSESVSITSIAAIKTAENNASGGSLKKLYFFNSEKFTVATPFQCQILIAEQSISGARVVK